MFRRQPGSLPKDPVFRDALNVTGHFIAEDGTIRQINKPTAFFVFRATDNERFNEVRKEAVNGAIRKELKKRMIKEGMQVWYLPQLQVRKPKEAHVPIFATPPEVLRRCKRVIVIVNEDSQDLGVFAWRDIGGEPGLDGGSVLAIVKELSRRFTNPVNGSWPVGQESSSDSDDAAMAKEPTGSDEATQVVKDLKKIQYPDAPGLIVLNPGQLRYSQRRTGL
ncbi:hypothetical protein H2199_005316 [Coniosporium tulheliwenetii]|uniref:Uncharacterized protein n=1 Tax=Coniosporium tulheliwenetii TaxID=3383036 RepID=A0ACC2Z1H5_9PEZI|nr:hypothetical protein H2199_005316 [Cladosporium sp. JES 115]